MLSLPIITELDAARIRELAARHGAAAGAAALGELVDMVTSEADIVPGTRIAADVVTVNSKVSFRDELSGTVHTVTLVYPEDFSISDRRISLLSPVGRALLGRRVGQTIPVDMPDGGTRDIRIVELHYQPEASGEFAR